MTLGPLFRFVALGHFALAATMVLPAILAATPLLRAGYALGMLCAVLMGGLCYGASVGLRPGGLVRAGLRELMLGLVIFWSVVPLTAAIPFIVRGYGLDEGWFEAVSALTTTGAWFSDALARINDDGMIYRASLQWLGGLVSLATAAAVFIRPEFIGIEPLSPPFSQGEEGSYLLAFERAMRAFLPVYTLITLIGGLAFWAVGVPAADALTMALSLIASGGFVPNTGGIAAYPPAASAVAGTLMVLSGLNFILIAILVLGRASTKSARQDPESRAFLLLVPCLGALYWLSLGAGDWARLPEHLFNAASFLSTNAIVTGEVPALVPVLVTVIIGGAAVSTAGGIKLLRWLITFRRAGEELWRLTHPGGVLGQKISVNLFGVWIHTLAFAVILAVIVLITAFFGFSLEASVAAAVAVVANAGPLLALAPEMGADYRVFDPILRLVFGLGMIAGRLELVVLLVLINRRFWQG